MKKAVTLFKSAANQGYAYAQFNLAVAYEFNHGVLERTKRKPSVSTRRLRIKAILVLRATYIFQHGKFGLDKHVKEAVRLYTLAANQGSANAQDNLGKPKASHPHLFV